MNTLNQTTTSWIKQIPGELFKLDETPLLGYPPLFPWADFAAQIAKTLQIEEMSLAPAEWHWRAKDELFAGLGDNLKSLRFTIVPLAGSVFWVMPQHEISHLMNYLLTKQQRPSSENVSAEFWEAFYQFLTLEIIDAFEKINSDKQLSITFEQKDALPSNHCLCQDIAISLKDLTVHGRLFLTPEFRSAWMQRYLQQQNKAIYSNPLAEQLSVIVHLEAGKVSLKPSEWKKINPGDLILLDSCSLVPDEDKGRIQLVINGYPFFRGKIKDGNIKILEHPLYHEADIPMTNPPKNQADDEDIFDDSELDSEINSEIENTTQESDIESDIESDFESGIDSGIESTIESEIESELETGSDFTESESELESDSEFTESDLSSGFENESLEPSKSSFQTNAKKTSTPPLAKATPPTSKPLPSKSAKTPITIEEIPLNIVVEVGRLQMSVKKLLELQPGNMLDLNIHPEAGVDLVLNGKRIAKGELLRIGDALGVRIIDLS